MLVSDKVMSDYFELCIKLYSKPKIVINWLTGDILKYLNANSMDFSDIKTTPDELVQMLKMIDENIISGKIAKTVIEDMLSSGEKAEQIVREKGLIQITDESEIEDLAGEVIKENQKVVNDYISGKSNAIGFLVGELMKKTKGKANPQLASKILKKMIEDKV